MIPEDMAKYGERLVEISHEQLAEMVSELKMLRGMEDHIPDAMVFITSHMMIDSIKTLTKVAPEGQADMWENAVLSMVIGTLRHVFKRNILMEGEDKIITDVMKYTGAMSERIGNAIKEKLKYLGVIEDWDFKFPIKCKVDGKETNLTESEKKDLYLPDTELVEINRREGKQMQLQDEQGNQYWAYFYKGENGKRPLVVQRP